MTPTVCNEPDAPGTLFKRTSNRREWLEIAVERGALSAVPPEFEPRYAIFILTLPTTFSRVTTLLFRKSRRLVSSMGSS